MFFRNPARKIAHTIPSSVLSPADGVVVKIVENASLPKEYAGVEGKWKQISIFMRVQDVHINRFPISGVVKQVHHIPGKFKYAAASQADTDNERCSMLIEGNFTVVCQQVAGMLARRIVCNAIVGDKAQIGEVYGMIQIGSRADIYIPTTLNIQVKKGDRVFAGLTSLAS